MRVRLAKRRNYETAFQINYLINFRGLVTRQNSLYRIERATREALTVKLVSLYLPALLFLVCFIEF